MCILLSLSLASLFFVTDHDHVVPTNEELLGVAMPREAPIPTGISDREHGRESTRMHVTQLLLMGLVRDRDLRDVHQQYVHVLVKGLEKARARATHAVDTTNDHKHTLALQEAAS